MGAPAAKSYKLERENMFYCVLMTILPLARLLNPTLLADFHIGDNALDIPSYSTKVGMALFVLVLLILTTFLLIYCSMLTNNIIRSFYAQIFQQSSN